MIRHHATTLRLAFMVADAILAMVLFAVIAAVRFGPGWAAVMAGYGLPAPIMAAAWAVAWTGLLWALGLYRMRVRWTLRREVLDIARAGVLLGLLLFGILFLLHLPQVSRLFLAMLLPGQVALTVATRLLIRWWLRRRRAAGYGAHYMLIVGAGDVARAFATRIERRRDIGLRVIGLVATEPDELGRPNVIGPVGELQEIIHSRVVDEVGICLPVERTSLIEPVTRICEGEGKIVRIPLTDGVPELLGGRVEDFDGVPLLSLVYGPDRAIALAIKRLIDVVGGLVGLVLLAPLLLVVALAIALRDGRPIIFAQERVGLHGRPFRLVKFRTMVPDAEARLEELLAQNEIQGPAFKITSDPRTTGIGRFLRRSSIDELPQLVNVVRGDMSLVGPRPPLPVEVAAYDQWHRRRLSMKPGMTGLWQVSARDEDDFDRWVELDLAYIDRWSLLLDLRILVGTIRAVIRQSGR